MLTFSIPGLPPSKSNAYRRGRGRTFFKNPAVVQYERDFCFAVAKTPKHTFGELDRLGVRIDWAPPHLRSDLDGIAKILLDCCQKTGIIWNDNKVDQLVMVREAVNKKNPYVVMSIWEIPPKARQD